MMLPKKGKRKITLVLKKNLTINDAANMIKDLEKSFGKEIDITIKLIEE